MLSTIEITSHFSVPTLLPKKTLPATAKSSSRLSGLLLTVLVALSAYFLLSSPAAAWWNDDWSMRKKISIDTSATGADITDFDRHTSGAGAPPRW